MTLKEKAVKGVGWIALAEYIRLSLQFLTKIVLARLLMPADFGIVALAYIAINGLKIFDNLGIGPALIQRKDNIDEAGNSAFFLLPCIGIILFIVSYAMSSTFSHFFESPTVTPVVQALSIIFIMRAFSVVPHSFLTKELQYKKLFIVNTLSVFFNSTIAICMALRGYGVWSLVAGHLTASIIRTLLMWLVSPFRPSFNFSFKISKELFSFGKHILGLSIIMFIYNHIDNFIVGKVLGVTALGFYSVAYTLSNLGSNYITSIFNRISFPIYSKIQDDIPKIKSTYLKFLSYSSLISLPLMSGMFILAFEMIKFIYGDKWIDAAYPLQILCIFGMIRSIDTSIGHVFWGIGKPKITQQVGFVNLIVMVIIIYPLTLRFGLVGTALAITIAKLITMIVNFSILIKVVRGNTIEIIKVLFIPLSSSFVMVLGLYGIKTHWLTQPIVLNFIFLIILGIVIYFSSVYLLNKNLINEVKELIQATIFKKNSKVLIGTNE